jgi:RNA polymerase sigma factor (sigma-70 family)
VQARQSFDALPDGASALAVRSALASLPARQRAVIVARFYAGPSVAETGAALGCAEGTVKVHVHRALAALRSLDLDEVEEVVAHGPTD